MRAIVDHPELAIFGVETEPPARTLVDILSATMDAHPEEVAIESATATITYSQLRGLLDEQAARLHAKGIGPGDRVGIRVPSGTTDLYVAILSTLWAGAAYVPVDWDDPDSRADTVWEEASVAAVYGKDLAIVDKHGGGNPDHHVPTLDDDAWVIFTSGSTGKPKGVAVQHRAAAALVDAEARMYLTENPLGPGDRVMAGLSVAFDASCEEMWLAWRYGATLVTVPRDVVRSGEDLGEWIISQGITAVSTVPTLASLWPADALEAVRLLIFGGEACPAPLIQRLSRPGRELWNTYGPTEATVISTGALMIPDVPVRIGRPVPGWACAVVDSENQPVKWGETGELIVAGVGLGRYLDPVKDAECYTEFPALGWERGYRTGDLVRAEQEGLIFAGRADDQIKFAGRRMELGEIDEHLTNLPNVNVGAAALHKTEAGSPVLVGYLSAKQGATIDMAEIRSILLKRLPGGIVPLLHVVDEMPMKTSGKVDRKALPWPLPSAGDDAFAGIDPSLHWLAERWHEQLGPVPLDDHSDFFDLGGSSVAIAKLVVALREAYPNAEIAELYNHRSLRDMGQYLESLDVSTEERPLARPIPWYSGFVQAAFVCFLHLINGLRYVVGSIIVVWVLAAIFNAGWVPQPPVLPLIVGWLLLFSIPGRMLQTAIGVRLLCFRIKPGEYLRGGLTHLRIWAAERLLIYENLDIILGSPAAVVMNRLLGNRVGRHCHLHQQPCVTGLVSIGDNVSIEHEADVSGHWLDGDTLHVGTIDLEDGVRIGTRTLVSPNSKVGADSEILPGSHVTGSIPSGQFWGGSPIFYWGKSGETWPSETPEEVEELERWGSLRSWGAYSLGMFLVEFLPILAVFPGGLLVFQHVRTLQRYEDVFPILALYVPIFTLLTVASWLGLVILCVRTVAPLIALGYFPSSSSTGWAVWLTHTLLQRTLKSAYFLYASCYTPMFLRALGATVGKNTEISTVETIPHLTCIEDGSFLADHALVNCARSRGGWIHIGSAVIGERSFVGNSAIVGPDRDIPSESLIAVLSSTPYQPESGTCWLGRKATAIPRVTVASDQEKTYNPPQRLKIARALVEACRVIPLFIAAWLDLAIVYAGTLAYMSAGGISNHRHGLILALLWSGPIVIAAATAASIIPIIAKWLLVGSFKHTQVPLFSTLVWRSELADTFAEMLAVPSMIRMSLGSPLYNVWARLMGTKIGKSVWCETWWLPEFDLISIDARSTVNRGTVLQTHLFHDRVMAMEPVQLGSGATLGPNSFMLPGSSIGERSTVGPGSLVLRDEQLPPNSQWAGNPVRHVDKIIRSTNAQLTITHH